MLIWRGCNKIKKIWTTMIMKIRLQVHWGVRVMVFNATYINISAISWQSVLLVEETGIHRENQSCHRFLENLIFPLKNLVKKYNALSLNCWKCNSSIIFNNRVMVFNTTFNNISVISWRSVLLIDCIEYTLPWEGLKLTTLVVIGRYWLHR